MLDLAVLLSISLAITAILGLLLAGFVWVPWLIGFVLVGLLVALTKLASLAPAAPLADDELFVEQAGFSKQDSSQSTDETSGPVMIYRGAKYQSHPAASAEPTPHEGLYRGQRWRSWF
jgi:hypothetical protein